MKELDKQKRALRTSLRGRLHALGPAFLSHKGERAALEIAPFIEDQRRSSPTRPVALFASMPDELDTRPLDEWLRARNIGRAFPSTVAGELVFREVHPGTAAHDMPVGGMGIHIPPLTAPQVDLEWCSAIVVPGLAFDIHGARMGYGRGYYDRALRHADLERCVGLCLDEQLVDDVPMASHDLRLRWLCTPARGVFRTA